MGKQGILGLVAAVVLGFLAFFTLLYTGEFQSKSTIEPIHSAMTVGEMRLTPHSDPDAEATHTPEGEKGVRVRDLMAEVNNEIKRGIETNVIYIVDWKFVDIDGNEVELNNSVLNGEGNFESQRIKESFDTDLIVHEAEYTIHRYNNSQAKKDDDGNAIGVIDKSKPVNSTKFRWSVYADEKVHSEAPTGLTGGERVVADYYTKIEAGSGSSESGVGRTGWDKSGNYWYYYQNGRQVSGWQTIGGKEYYFDSNRRMVTGWQTLSGRTYFFNTNGGMATGWVNDGGNRYYFDSKGNLTTDWQQVSGTWYYFEKDGKMAKGWKELGDYWYYLKSDGKMATGWENIAGDWYYLKSNGRMATGWEKIGSNYYFLNPSGRMATGWKKVDDNWYYLNPGGSMVVGWKKVDGYWYYLDKNGAMVTGTHTIDGKKYTFDSSGRMQ